MSRIRLYFDEDAMHEALLVAVRARRVDAVTALECGMVNRSDEQHLFYSSGAGRVLYSYNVRDFNALHAQWVAAGREHGGMILAVQQRYSVGEQLRRLLRIINHRSAEGMRSRIEYSSSWA